MEELPVSIVESAGTGTSKDPTWEDLEVGLEVGPLRYIVTPEMVADFCAALPVDAQPYGAGGICAGPPRTLSVSVHHTRNVATMNVVICMMRSALWLDSGRPLILHHQKYTVTRIANAAAKRLGGTW